MITNSIAVLLKFSMTPQLPLILLTHGEQVQLFTTPNLILSLEHGLNQSQKQQQIERFSGKLMITSLLTLETHLMSLQLICKTRNCIKHSHNNKPKETCTMLVLILNNAHTVLVSNHLTQLISHQLLNHQDQLQALKLSMETPSNNVKNLMYTTNSCMKTELQYKLLTIFSLSSKMEKSSMIQLTSNQHQVSDYSLSTLTQLMTQEKLEFHNQSSLNQRVIKLQMMLQQIQKYTNVLLQMTILKLLVIYKTISLNTEQLLINSMETLSSAVPQRLELSLIHSSHQPMTML